MNRNIYRNGGKVARNYLQRGGGGGSSVAGGSAAATVRIRDYDFVAADFIADNGLYRLDVTHDLNTTMYGWTAFDRDSGSGVAHEEHNQGATMLKLWFHGNVKNITVNIWW